MKPTTCPARANARIARSYLCHELKLYSIVFENGSRVVGHWQSIAAAMTSKIVADVSRMENTKIASVSLDLLD